MKKTFLCFLVVLLAGTQAVISQTFPTERDKFVKTWQQLVTDESALNYLKGDFSQQIKGSLLNETQFKKLVDNCNSLSKKEVATFPEIYHFMRASIAIVERKVAPSLANPWTQYVFDYSANPDEKLSNFLQFSMDFFQDFSFFKDANYRWTCSGGTVDWLEAKTLQIKVQNANLKCYYFNKQGNQDSIVVYQTSGVFDLQTKKWVGSAGTVTWQKAGLPKAETFATLKNYKCDFNAAKLKADSVLLTTPYFSTPILGRLTDLTYMDLTEQEAAPKFSSYEQRLKISNLREQMDYDGSFTLNGADFIGKGTASNPAKLIFKRAGKPLFEISADGFEMSPKQIVARDAKAVMRYKNGDSVSIQECFFTFDETQQLLRLAAGQKGTEYFPFIDNYFKVYCYAPILNWKKGSPEPFFTYDVGTAQERKVARFESMDYFDANLYGRFSGVGAIHPFSQIANLVDEKGKTLFTEGELANALKKTIDQVKPLFVDLAAAGFLVSEPKQKKWLVTQKLLAYAAASQGASDYDNLRIESDLRKSKEQAYATVQLDQQVLYVREVKQVVLSTTQQVSFYPDTTLVTLLQNRDIVFSGLLKAGKCEVLTKQAKFEYENFLVNLYTTQDLRFRVKPLQKEDGTAPIEMLSSLKAVKGTIYIDKPTNKAGKVAGNGRFPYIITAAPSFVYYNKPEILRGAYDSTRFYYQVANFEMDSLDNFSEQSLKLEGQLISAGIFPKLNEPLRIMKDYSFGFVTAAPTEGLAFYETSSKYKNQIYLSNNGLQGSGTIEFLHTTAISKKLTFLPDSTIGLVQFSAPQRSTGIRYPRANAEKAYMSYQPKKASMKIASYGDELLSLFAENVALDGEITIDQKAMSGKGALFYKDAQLTAQDFQFTDLDIRSENAAFALRNRFSTYGENPLAIQSDEMKAHLSFETRVGEFISNGTKRIMFPANEYYCQMDKFNWFMDAETLDFKKNKGGETTFESGADLTKNNFYSTAVKQDSLQFKSLSAKYDLKTQLIVCDAVDFIQVGDARIFPDSSRVRIRKAATMDTLKNANILANYITKFHRFEQANIQIGGRFAYNGNAYYPYYDRDSVRTTIQLSKISYEQTKTVAEGNVTEKAAFQLSPEFAYFGKVRIEASHPGLVLDGSTKLAHPCQYNKSWMAFKDTIIAKQIQIPIAENPKDANGRNLAVGFVWRQTERKDSLRIYPAFLSVKEGPQDPSVFSAAGYIQYNEARKQFELGSKARLDRTDSLSNLLVLDAETCELAGFGAIQLGIQTGEFQIDLHGKISYDKELKKTKIAANAKVQIPLDNSILNAMIDQFKAAETAPEWGLKKPIYGLRNSLSYWSNAKEAQEVFKDFDEEKLRKMPTGLQQTFILSGIVLESFGSDQPSSKKNDKGLIGVSQSVGLISINGQAVNQPVELTQCYVQCFSDQCNPSLIWELQSFDGTRYILSHEQDKKDGLLSIYSSNKTFLTAIENIKADKRQSKNFKYEPIDETAASAILAKLRSYLLYK
ncbi:MAG: hypothetical protein ACKOWW_02045 [Flavobacteriales bacterium]